MTPGQAVRQHCLQCIGAATGGQAHDCGGVSCSLYACHPFRGKLLPITHRPSVYIPAIMEGKKAVTPGYVEVRYDEQAETARLAEFHAQVPKRQPSGALCTAMCRECMGVRITDGMADEQKGGGARADCGKRSCAMYPWQPYKPGGKQRREMDPAKRAKLIERGRKLAAGRKRTANLSTRLAIPGACAPSDSLSAD